MISFLIDFKVEYLVYHIVNSLQVPITWKIFLNDQRGPRKLDGVLSYRTLSLRAASNRELADQELKQTIRFRLEETREQDQLENTCDIGYEETEFNCSNSVESENESDSDSDWEDIEVEEEYENGTHIYNTMSLRYFARECDRYNISDRAGAKIGNGLLKDLGIVRKGCTDKLIGPSKLRRERIKWGKKLAEACRTAALPQVTKL